MKLNVSILAILLCIPFLLGAEYQRNAALPKKAEQFLQVHFKSTPIKEIEYDDGKYEVKLRSGHEIEFDAGGNWIDIEGEYSPLPKSIIDLLPQKATAYIANNYPRRPIVQIKKKKYGYKIDLSNSAELMFSFNGDFLGKD
ncbi:PepSY-like domain-containing protein [Dysgonomonas macrotermitis]|uniref:Putative beta-lactamase-inhibitor-like, PepSY-like n=1 Tax=Dysgonomonas macrotermitis TaxID=1346286 RepID=A0A1M4ZWM7_9BACT|nr:PepSY-like domain-containing protein [Dysgonomonas macrotermitis]SHF22016.1 Putative beta-lactamase-inhibitor-like, PepSY-like [Dysgonomonas macrotermitis]